MSIDENKLLNLAGAQILYNNLRNIIDDKLDNDLKGAPNGLAELDANGKVPSTQLPSYVDDVLEFNRLSNFPVPGENGKIYVALDTNLTYRWSGTSYVQISSALALGETSSTAYRGDRGAIAYNHANNKGNAYANGLYKISTNAEGHVTDASLVTKQDIVKLGIPENVPTKLSELTNDVGFLTSYEETDPTVPAWAKSANKPEYTAQEVGAIPMYSGQGNTRSIIVHATVPSQQGSLLYLNNRSIAFQVARDDGMSYVHAGIQYKTPTELTLITSSQLGQDHVKISNIATPTEDYDVANKYYVDHTTTKKISDLISDNDFVNSDQLNNLILIQDEQPVDDDNNKIWIKDNKDHVQIPTMDDLPTKLSDLTNDVGFITSYTETDPTVPAWAKASTKPSYTAAEVGALPNTTVIPDKTSDLQNDSNFITDTELSNLILIQQTQPNSEENKLWIPDEAETLTQIPTMDDIPTRISDLIDDSGHYTKPATGIPASDLADGVIPEGYVQDVQVSGTSILNNGIANIPITGYNTLGVCSVNADYGIYKNSDGILYVQAAISTEVKAGTNQSKPIVPNYQHHSVFYGLAKAAGDTTQSASSNAVGTYTDTAKDKIKDMLDVGTVTETISETTPTITAKANHRYVCGEVSSISFTPCASGICDVRFTSGSNVAVLTVPNTVKWPEWFDPTALDTDTIYELNVMDGVYGAVMTWEI